jgi:lipoate-protein ligase A
MIVDAKSRVSGLNRTLEEVASELKDSFSEKFSAQIIEDDITELEKEDCKKKVAQKYSSHQWNHRR